MKKRAYRPKRKVVRRKRRSTALQVPKKTYNYKFHLLPQVLISDPLLTTMNFVTNPLASGQRPLDNGSTFAQYPGACTLPGFVDLAFACTFRLADIQNLTPYIQMYDAYKINSITLELEYLNNSSLVGSTGLMPTVRVYNDQDDAIPPPNLTSLVAKTGTRMKQFGHGSQTKFRFTFKPTILKDVGNNTVGAGTTISSIAKSCWLNCNGSGSSVDHYSMKMWISDVYAPGPLTTVKYANGFRFNWIYNVSFRSPTEAT